MKICYISESTFPSTAANTIQSMKMCQAMAKAGHDVTLVGRLRRERTMVASDDELWEHYGIRHPFRLHQIYQPGPLSTHFYGLRTVPWALRNGCEVIFTRHLQSAAWAALRGLPTVLEIHALHRHFVEKFYVNLFQRGNGAKRLVFISQTLRDDFLAHYESVGKSADVVVAHDGVDMEPYADVPDKETARRELGLPADRFIAGYVGHFYAGKGVELILDLAEQRKDVLFALVGGTAEDRARVSGHVAAQKLENVLIHDFVPNDAVPHWLSAFDALLLPLQSTVKASGGLEIARWTSPLKLFEYMASERPLVASSLTVLREVIGDSNSFICACDVLDEWARALDHLKSHPEEGKRRAEQAARDVLKYTWDARARSCLDGL